MSWSEVKYALNSTVGTEDFAPLDEMIKGAYAIKNEYKYPGTYPLKVPAWAKYALVTACGGGGSGGNSYEDSGNYYRYTGGGGGGGGAAVYQQQYDVSGIAGTTINVTVGTGGVPLTASPYGVNGGATIISGIVTLGGGKCGKTPTDAGDTGLGGAAGGTGGGAGGDRGEAGGNGVIGVGSPAGTGGDYTAGGGGGGSLGSHDNPYINYGAGGSGRTSSPWYDGANLDLYTGRDGYVLIMFSPTTFD